MALSLTDRVVATAMAAGAGFDTGAVTWPVGRGHRRKRSPNRATIRALKKRRFRWLRKHGQRHPDLTVMAAEIAACGRGRLRDRCLHPVCPRCAHAVQRLLVRTVSRFTASRPAEVWKIISIILPPLDPIGETDFRAEGLRYAAMLREVGITIGVFGLDWSSNEDHRQSLPETERFAAYTCVHLFGFAPAAQLEAAETRLKKLVPPTDAVPRPVHVKAWDGGLAAIGYALKQEFQRRQTILEDDPRRDKPVRDTRDRDLTVDQQIQAVRALTRAGQTGRIVLLGLRFKAVELGRLRLVPTL
ncbi:hypothetical protein [Methylobacterium sp. WL6]|uniref:hypothetical protein n=1 Tax=Methylobacterium sp. WL6 TaxID=2603901 RepID=UPI0011C831A5|nr:hypothetical protein [Methylobacterium sp. WL6]TXN73692.1 hypothetical protein FV230_00190 [Methylobacterium sp. WL6]